MEHVDFTTDLQDLRQSLRRMQALRAWRRLKEHEARPGQPPSFQAYDPTEADLENEYSFFLFIRTRVCAALRQRDSALSKTLRVKVRREWAVLDRKARRLGLSAGPWRR
jgi:hypothetical protein